MAKSKSRKVKKRRQSANRLLYMKERRRISNMVRRLRSKGYDISIADIAGNIPKRVTKQAIAKLQKIRSSQQALEQAQKKQTIKRIEISPPVEVTTSAPTMEEIAIQNFRDKFENYHSEVYKAINQWIDYVLKHFGEQALIDALDDIAYEGIELSSYGGYLIPPGDLELYLHKISHFIMGDENSDLQDLTQEVMNIIEAYNSDLTDYETEDWGSWSFTGSRKNIGTYSQLSQQEKLKLLKDLGLA